ncbi:MAG TPA: 3-hydroxyacyl-CoA dehydrogenase family protein, partial [Anaerolineae bacterium]
VTLVASPVLTPEIRTAAEKFFHGLGRHVVWIEDSPALILPRIVAMLVNEAAFAVGEGVANDETIDLAMKLGVNYPKGPFAWAKELGYRQVVAVLDHLLAEFGEERYRTAPLLRRLARLAQLSERL